MSFVSRRTIADRLLRSKKARDSYVIENIKRVIPFQLRTMRDEREWSQAKAGEAIGKPQNVVSRLESPAYGKLTLQTLIEIAHGFDVGLLIKFVPLSRLVTEYEDVTPVGLSAKSVSDKREADLLNSWAEREGTAKRHRRTKPARQRVPRVRDTAKAELNKWLEKSEHLSSEQNDLMVTPNENNVLDLGEHREKKRLEAMLETPEEMFSPLQRKAK